MKRTKALDALAAAKVAHEVREFEASEFTAEETARELGLPLSILFKTLVVRGERRGVMLALVSGERELSLRKLAQAAGDKRVEMVDVAELPRLTGYLKGGCSPLGIKVGGRTGYPTFIDASAFSHERISISAGLRGVQVLLDPRDLARLTNATKADLTDA
ncbi:MAG TPA: aminoacyl-tRNA deacylase [Thermoflexales bacterium]|jgi:Cys-tRNA(Pro)/Cys-tRNA(Cys) deacylase|nr:aminoacyl-tRNA deacylase [Anaerolineae bacterium]HQV30097.1 aminoacyl-tRNA deacylase [Thermoflexales bacterium]HQX12259.1 aminoacyl-tRNA deacylase [Thermoflexales bacterium]HQY26042.1 aminoacyl-tRNA deacylase [Thermoflexales bacterium]